jgi:hypothetical protein
MLSAMSHVRCLGAPALRSIPHKYTAVLAVVAAVELLDLATFIPAVTRMGVGAEDNPLARTLYLVAGPLGPAALKAAGTAIILLALARVVRRFPTKALPSAALASAIGLFGVASNIGVALIR